MGTAIKCPVLDRVKPSFVNSWHPGSLTLIKGSLYAVFPKIFRTKAKSCGASATFLSAHTSVAYDNIVWTTMCLLNWELYQFRHKIRVGTAGGWGVEPQFISTNAQFLSENRFQISISGQKFKHFDIWPPVLLDKFQHCIECLRANNVFYISLHGRHCPCHCSENSWRHYGVAVTAHQRSYQVMRLNAVRAQSLFFVRHCTASSFPICRSRQADVRLQCLVWIC